MQVPSLHSHPALLQLQEIISMITQGVKNQAFLIITHDQLVAFPRFSPGLSYFDSAVLVFIKTLAHSVGQLKAVAVAGN